MKKLALVFGLVAALAGGCAKPERETIQDGISARMTDEQILSVLGLVRAKMSAKEERGDDGFSVIYTDEKHEVWITRSVVSGLVVMRMEPESERKIWHFPKEPIQASETTRGQ